jgi:microsomal dipeptidase-like Zn-dependent dipeptidase
MTITAGDFVWSWGAVGMLGSRPLHSFLGLSNVSGSPRIMANLVTSGLQRSDLRGLLGKNVVKFCEKCGEKCGEK